MSRDIRELEKWIQENARLAYVYTIGLAVLVLEIAGILDQLLQRLVQCVR